MQAHPLLWTMMSTKCPSLALWRSGLRTSSCHLLKKPANMREVRRRTNLLLKVQRRKGQLPETREVTHDVVEKEGT